MASTIRRKSGFTRASCVALGTHLTVDFFGCDSGKLNDPDFLMKVAREAAKETNSRILGEMLYAYDPYGISIVIFLADSHLSIHTWPEYGYVAADIFTCSGKADPMKGRNVLCCLLSPRTMKSKNSARGKLIEVGVPRNVPNIRSKGSLRFFQKAVGGN